MKQIFIILALLCTPCLAQQSDPPKDSGKYYLTIFTHEDWAKREADTALIGMLRAEPMNAVAKACHFNHYTPKSIMFVERFSGLINSSRLPAVLLQKSVDGVAGGTIYLAYSDELPASSQELFDDMKYFSRLLPSTDVPVEEIIPWDESREQETVDADFLFSSIETWGRKAPIRDSIAGGVSMFYLVFATLMLLAVAGVAAVFLKVMK